MQFYEEIRITLTCHLVRRVYDVCQYIFSGEGEYTLDIHYIFSQQDLSDSVFERFCGHKTDSNEE